jgi:hypothetical protein
MPVGARAPAQVTAALDEIYAQTGFGQSARRAHAGHATTHYDRRFSRGCLEFIHDLAALLVLPLLSSPKAHGMAATEIRLVNPL